MSHSVPSLPRTGSAASPDRQEWDITLDYRPPFQPLDNLWIRLRRAEVWEDGPNGNGLVDYRVIVNYRFQIL